jgi:hypothetical protein
MMCIMAIFGGWVEAPFLREGVEEAMVDMKCMLSG